MDANLKTEYAVILRTLKRDVFNPDEDHYSGVFLPKAYDEYRNAPIKVMLVGIHTVGWNTDNNKNTMRRVFNAIERDDLGSIIDESESRNDDYDKWAPKSKFFPFHGQLAEALGLIPKGVVWGNLSAWDYEKEALSKKRPRSEAREIDRVSLELLAAQIKAFEPEHIVFAGKSGDGRIKNLFDRHLGGRQDWDHSGLCDAKYLWGFKFPRCSSGAGTKDEKATCYRIYSPSWRYADSNHRQYRCDTDDDSEHRQQRAHFV